MNRLNRKKQREILELLADAYPEKLSGYLLQTEENEWPIADLFYLEEHGLITLKATEAKTRVELDKPARRIAIGEAGITSKGIDFLENDGGLSAILNVVTVRLHEEALLEVIEKYIDAQVKTDAEKSSLLSSLKALPAEGIKFLTVRLLEKGVDHAQDVIPLIQNVINSFRP